MPEPLNPIRIALVGCGAVARSHARAVASVEELRCAALYDLDEARAQSLRKSYCRDAIVLNDLSEIARRADAAIVAVPNAYHAEVSVTLLRAGLHVLCEKPLAITLDDAGRMAAVAQQEGRILTCGHVRRFYGSTRLVSEALRRELVGKPVRVDVRESVWNWPLSRAAFDPQISGGGMLIDIGPHVFDLLEYWLGPVEVIEYRDDNCGGVEAVASVKIRCGNPGEGIEGDILLTRAYRALNRTRIYCSRGYIDVDPHRHDSARVTFSDDEPPFVATASESTGDPFASQLRSFAASIQGEARPVVSSEAAVRAVSLVETCYRKRELLTELPRGESAVIIPEPVDAATEYRKILVTGASGAVGSRLVEMWAAEGRLSQLRCMVRSYRTAARILRFPVETVEANLLDKESLRQAARGCDAIIHLGVGEKAGRETQMLVDMAVDLGIRRFVHMSTAAVYGRAIPAFVERCQEETDVRRTGEPYADEKARAERFVLKADARGLEAVVLRPHMVYGPGLRWSAELIELLAGGRVPILEDGGWCNLIYVDDLVEAVRKGLTAKAGLSKPVFVTDGCPIGWSHYIASHAEILGVEPPRITRRQVISPDRSLRQWARDSVKPLIPVLRSRQFRDFILQSPAMQATAFRAYLAVRDWRAVRPCIERLRAGSDAIDGQQPDGVRFDEMWTALQLSEARLSADRAEELLGFRARISFSEGLRRTSDWLALYGLVPRSADSTEQSMSGSYV